MPSCVQARKARVLISEGFMFSDQVAIDEWVVPVGKTRHHLTHREER